MPQQQFQFKKFLVEQGGVAMRVNTDGVLLGAWVQSKSCYEKSLDIGTGTGVISLMMAQRFPLLTIDAIDIEEEAFLTSNKNFIQSIWSDRLSVCHTSLQNFSPSFKYDLIVTNPPYFTKSFQSHKKEKNTARHNDVLPFDVLLDFVFSNLTQEGMFACVLPVSEKEKFVNTAHEKGLFLNRDCTVFPTPTKQSNRVLMEFSKQKKDLLVESIIIRDENSNYTTSYSSLTKDFYTIF